MRAGRQDAPGAAPRRVRVTPPGPALLLPVVLVLVLVLVLVAACRPGPGQPGARADGAEAHTTAMAPGSELDPPDLANLPQVAVTGGVPVLCYHYFRGRVAPGYALRVLGSVLFGLPALGPREFWTTPAAEFERHLRMFRDEGISVVTLDEVAAALGAGDPLPARAVVLTIDDADRSVHRHAFPLLRKYGVRAHLFVPTARIGEKWSGLSVCTAAELAEMAASGHVLLDSHTHDLHYKLPAPDGMRPAFLVPELIPPARRPAPSLGHGGPLATVARDLETSRDVLARLAPARSPWLAWPYGFASPAHDDLGAAVGFRGTVSLAPRRFAATDTRLRPGRFAVTANTTLAQVRDLVR